MNTKYKNYHSCYCRNRRQVAAQIIALQAALGHEPTPDELLQLGGYIAKALDQEIAAHNYSPTVDELIHSLGTVMDINPRTLTAKMEK